MTDRTNAALLTFCCAVAGRTFSRAPDLRCDRRENPPLDEREIMNIDAQLDHAAIAAAEEVLRVIYGDDLEGCTVSVDRIAALIRRALDEQANHRGEVTQLHAKGFEAVQLLSTPPADGAALSPNDLRSMLSERLDKIHSLASQIIAATAAATDATTTEVREPDE